MMGRFVRAAVLSLAAACTLSPAFAQGVVKALTVTPDHTTGLVAPTTDPVSENYMFWLVNSGQQLEEVEAGFGDASDSVIPSMSSFNSMVGPGQTATVTVTVEGRGGLFPYWVDFWAGIVGAPETADTVRLSIDTVGSHTTPAAVRRVAGAETVRAAGDWVVVTGAEPGTMVGVFGADGRLVESARVPLRGRLRVRTGTGFWVVRLAGGEEGRSVQIQAD